MTIGIDIGGTHIKAGIVDADGSLVVHHVVPSHADEGVDAMLLHIEQVYRHLAASTPLALGIGCPGVVDADGVVHDPPNMAGWSVVPLRHMLAERLGCLVAVDNDANVAAIAEADAGAGAQVASFIYVTLGTGIGGAIVLDRHILRGPSGGAGEIGHCIIDRTDVSTMTGHRWRAGTVEEYAGRQGICDAYARRTGVHANVEQISQRYAEDDAQAVAVVDEAAYHIALALCSTCAVLGMQTIIIGGGIADAFPDIGQRIASHMHERALPTIAEHLRILPATFRNHAGIIGAALLARRLL